MKGKGFTVGDLLITIIVIAIAFFTINKFKGSNDSSTFLDSNSIVKILKI